MAPPPSQQAAAAAPPSRAPAPAPSVPSLVYNSRTRLWSEIGAEGPGRWRGDPIWKPPPLVSHEALKTVPAGTRENQPWKEERALLLAGLTITRNVEFSQVERMVVGLAVPFPFPPYPSSCTPHP